MDDDAEARMLSREREILGENADYVISAETSSPSEVIETISISKTIEEKPPGISTSIVTFETLDAGQLLAAFPQPKPGSTKNSAGRSLSANSSRCVRPQPVIRAPAPPLELPTEHLSRWSEEFQAAVAARDAEEEKAKITIVEKAKEEIDQFYKEYNERRERVLQESKETQDKELNEMNDTTKGTFWERVARYVDTISDSRMLHGSNTGHSNTSAINSSKKPVSATNNMPSHGGAHALLGVGELLRFRQVLNTLRKDKEAAPGA